MRFLKECVVLSFAAIVACSGGCSSQDDTQKQLLEEMKKQNELLAKQEQDRQAKEQEEANKKREAAEKLAADERKRIADVQERERKLGPTLRIIIRSVNQRFAGKSTTIKEKYVTVVSTTSFQEDAKKEVEHLNALVTSTGVEVPRVRFRFEGVVDMDATSPVTGRIRKQNRIWSDWHELFYVDGEWVLDNPNELDVN